MNNLITLGKTMAGEEFVLENRVIVSPNPKENDAFREGKRKNHTPSQNIQQKVKFFIAGANAAFAVGKSQDGLEMRKLWHRPKKRIQTTMINQQMLKYGLLQCS